MFVPPKAAEDDVGGELTGEQKEEIAGVLHIGGIDEHEGVYRANDAESVCPDAKHAAVARVQAVPHRR